MVTVDLLRKSLSTINANALIAEFLTDSVSVTAVSDGCERIALWSNALQQADAGNAALPFLAEMQRASHDVAALLAVSLYVPAAASMRAMGETALYYSYFRQHHAELVTLVRDPDFYISKADVFEFHKRHTRSYRKSAGSFGFPGEFNQWYSQLSAVVHGQLPGAWGKRMALSETKHVAAVLTDAVKQFTESVRIIHLFLLLTVGSELWGRFHHRAKGILLKGMPAARRELLGLDGKL